MKGSSIKLTTVFLKNGTDLREGFLRDCRPTLTYGNFQVSHHNTIVNLGKKVVFFCLVKRLLKIEGGGDRDDPSVTFLSCD